MCSPREERELQLEQDDFVSFDQPEPVFVQKRRVGIGRLRLGQEDHHRGARPAHSRGLRCYLVDDFKNNPDTFILENTDRLVFDHYDEQLYL